jgi:hypothetical protein
MYGVPQAGLTLPAVAGRLERGVRPHSRSLLAERSELPNGLEDFSVRLGELLQRFLPLGGDYLACLQN